MFRHIVVTAAIVAGFYFVLMLAIMPSSVASETAVKSQSVGPVAVASKPNQPIDDFTIVGLVETVKLASTTEAKSQVKQLWQQFEQLSALHNNVQWNKDGIKIYAYYYGFNSDFSEASLAIGYKVSDLSVKSALPKSQVIAGDYRSFNFQAKTKTAPPEAWQLAINHQNLLERYYLNSEGSIIKTDAIVITR